MTDYSKGKSKKSTGGPLMRGDWDSIKLANGKEVPAVSYKDSSGRVVCKMAISLKCVPSSIVLHGTDTDDDELYHTIPLLAKCKEQPVGITLPGELVQTLYCLDNEVVKSEPCPHDETEGGPHVGPDMEKECRSLMPDYQTIFEPLTMYPTLP